VKPTHRTHKIQELHQIDTEIDDNRFGHVIYWATPFHLVMIEQVLDEPLFVGQLAGLMRGPVGGRRVLGQRAQNQNFTEIKKKSYNSNNSKTGIRVKYR
jgi:hypothetical protein